MTADEIFARLQALPPEQVFGWAAAVLGLIALVLLLRLAGLRRLKPELAAMRADLAAAEAEGQTLREALAETRAQSARIPELLQSLDDLRNLHGDEQQLRISAETELRTLKAEHEARLEELRGMKKEMEDRFSTLAAGVLRQNSESFLKLASERFKSHEVTASEDLEKRKLAIENLVKPLNERLTVFDTRIKEIEKARGEAYGAIQQQVRLLAEGQQALGTETRKLVQALRAPKTRGRWGEMQLRQVFDMAGMAEHVDYTLEHHMQTDDGARRPDAIVQIPGGKSIVVDAKTPLEAYLDALESETPELQQSNLARHARHVRDHVKLLSSKAYQDQIPTTPDFVVMFIPGETFVAAAVESDPELIEFAFERKVLIATPTTLMALVKAIAYGWQQEKMAENALEVQKVAKDLYDRLNTFGSHLDAVGKALNRSVDHYNKAVGSLETRVLPSARKFEAMGVVTQGSEIESPTLVESQTRSLSSLPERGADQG
ncbi:DNA recombination protein RmuC [Pseudodonghicola flavimaris]|uniref:DNA recombination protein RmuC homolog n=1 Tax=Pseudodonghicola flavimaris TaxID=3050036 RepID=A0ABT7EWQ9_9RHOB|nr:DNA recombination protein RmuC [Pseudodonghicola flavimaris]MDK3016780.1 DNA recombination protein RmuC [Pseudodonghicola flavimaris]